MVSELEKFANTALENSTNQNNARRFEQPTLDRWRDNRGWNVVILYRNYYRINCTLVPSPKIEKKEIQKLKEKKCP
jgi:hypothetical protein